MERTPPQTIVCEIVHCSMGLCQLTKGGGVALCVCVGTLFRSLVLKQPCDHHTYPHSTQPHSSLLCSTTLLSSPVLHHSWLSTSQCPTHSVNRHCFSTLSGSRLRVLPYWFTLTPPPPPFALTGRGAATNQFVGENLGSIK